MAMTNATTEAIWLKNLLDDLGFIQKNVNNICDNESASKLVKTTKHHERCEHIDIQYHFIQEQIQVGTTTISWWPSKLMVVDVLTH